MKKVKTNLYVLTCVPKNKRSKAKERKIYINGSSDAVFQKIEEISAEGSYAFTVACK